MLFKLLLTLCIRTTIKDLILNLFFSVIFQLYTKAQQAKQNAEEAGRALKTEKPATLHHTNSHSGALTTWTTFLPKKYSHQTKFFWINIFSKNIETFLGNSSFKGINSTAFFLSLQQYEWICICQWIVKLYLIIISPVCADGRQVLSAECEHAGKGQGGMAKGTREGMRGTTLQGSQNLHQACVVQWSWVCLWRLPPQMFEIQAKERINFLRNTVWTHLNQLSQQCVTSDEVRHHRILLFIFTLTTN